MKRRQQFITDKYYQNLIAFFDSARNYWSTQNLDEDGPGQAKALKSQEIKLAAFRGLMLRYTAGEPIQSLVPHLENVVAAYEEYQKNLGAYEGKPKISPLSIEKLLFEYEEFVQIVSFCVLMHQPDLLKRFVKMTDDAGFYGDDVLYEDLIKKILPNRSEVDEFYHDLYTPLIEAIYADSSAEAKNLLSTYCSNWYPAFEKVQNYWHDTHLTMSDTDGSYFGYWALEAAAVAFLYEIDDSHITHMVYPRDLAEYAKNYKKSNSDNGPQKVYSGAPCTRDGYWYTPAQNNSLRHFKMGELMPEIKGSAWGATIWYWSGDKE